jgi:hypothetical protein
MINQTPNRAGQPMLGSVNAQNDLDRRRHRPGALGRRGQYQSARRRAIAWRAMPRSR